jgi:LysM repeat protein
MLTVLGIHIAAAGVFMMMSGCTTKRTTAVEPPPAPIMPPRGTEEIAPSPIPSAVFKPPIAVDRAPESIDAAGAGSYTIQKGDSLSKIAAKAGVSVREISELNNITDPNKIRVGQKILLPAHAKSLPSSPAPAAESKPKAKKSEGPATASGDTHVVQSGDTLGKLASRYGTSVAAFKSVNNLKGDTIRIGQKLVIPAAGSKAGSSASAPAETKESAPAVEAPAAAPAAPAPVPAVESAPAEATADAASAGADSETPFPYTVKEGDTLDGIAIKFSAKKDVIMRLNSLSSESVSPGQKLLIPWQ